MKPTYTLIFFFLFASSSLLFAQGQRKITGVVRDAANNEPLPGVLVKVHQSDKTATTNSEGYFEITINANEKFLTFHSVGYLSLQQNVGSAKLDIRLQSSNTALNEVVVVGYGTQSKKEFTGAASHISSETFKDASVQSFDQALAGKAAGVSISLPNGVLNNPPVIRIRGINSISLSSYPLVVVDGIPINTGNISSNVSVPNNPLGDINPADIESIDVLKDAASVSIYGSRAAGGVLIITTKRGKDGKAKVSYDGWVGVTKAVRLPELLNSQQYMDLKNEAVLNSKILTGNANNSNVASALFFPSYNTDGSLVDTRWYDRIYQTAVSHNHNLSVSGGNSSTKYFFSSNYSNQEGFFVKNNFERKGVRFNIDHDVTNWLSIGGNVSYNNTVNNAQNSGSLPSSTLLLIGGARLGFVLPPNVAPFNADGSYNLSSTGTLGPGKNLFTNTLYNPDALFNYSNYTSTNDHFIGNIHSSIRLLKNLKFNTNYALDRMRTDDITYLSPLLGSSAYSTGGSAINIEGTRNNWNFTNSLSYDQRFGEGHHLSALAGYDLQKFNFSSWGASQSNSSDPFFENYQGNWGTIKSTGNDLSEKLFRSSFFRLSYDYDSKYFITGNFRRDGNSALGENNKYGNFGGVSAGWSVSEEPFYKSSSLANVFDNLKLKASWGRVGNGNLPNDYGSLSLYGSSLYGSASTWAISQAGNPDLGWETSEQTNIGLNFGLLKSKIQVEVDYFNNNVNGLILSTPQSPSKGIPGNTILMNVGSMYNRGVEVAVNSTLMEKKDFSWKASLTYTHVNNKVTELSAGNADIIGYTHTTTEANNITRVGYSVSSLYGAQTAGVNPENGRRIFINKNGEKVQYSAAVPSGTSNWTYLDGRTAPAITVADYQILGNALPKWYGGFNNSFQFKAFDLSLNFTYSGGNKIMNGTRGTLLDQRFYNNSTEALNRWTTPGQVTNIPRLVYNDVISNGSSGFSISDNAEKADFLRLQQVVLGYRLPSTLVNKIDLSSVRFYVQVSNAFLITSYSGTDPESSSNGNSNSSIGIEKNSIGQGRTISLGLNVSF
ncbi:SusC/RagA family TonB-linked outer membrane protein [Pedobacter sp. HMWF019]|uniref:SusC/RagA family TonB-linked outer membrane protein n=1 Tax=Pedobacter sp. HMWF019 TaxID=2056856 RepID=UPI000D357002|nr:SusC/RagA family TonB-linked outer membrane protein [Pedobacter sp. HMWF019]PTS99609.1 SusC/RagA family TonB-linked outer membrane protein [Pedobacter sp. HMWF019]